MVTVLNVKLETIPINRGFFLITLAITLNYTILSLLMQASISWRLPAINKALILTAKTNQKNLLRKIKVTMKMLGKIEDLINSLSNYLTLNNIFSFLNFFLFSLMILFLGYDILAHDLGIDDVIFFLAGICFSFLGGLNCVFVIIYSMTFNHTLQHSIRIFNEIAINSRDIKIKKFCQIANLQISSTQSVLSCGLFVFNWRLIFTIISAFFSYLIMMIQFDNMTTFDALK